MHKLTMAGVVLGLSALTMVAADKANDEPSQTVTIQSVEPNLGLSKESREIAGQALNTLLGDFYLLYVKAQNYHWNVVGPQFNDLHLFFGTLYEQLADIVDKVAERIRALGLRAKGTLTDFAQESRLKEEPGVYPQASQMIRNLLNDYESIIRTIRNDVETIKEMDLGTSTFLSDLLMPLEKKAWMLRSYLQ